MKPLMQVKRCLRQTALGVAIFVVSSLELANEVKSVNYVTNKMKSAMEVATE